MTDQELAAEIRRTVAHLNATLNVAYKADLIVDLSLDELTFIGRSIGQFILSIKSISKPL